jgi:Peptidase M15
MSILLSGRVKVALSVLATTAMFLFVPAQAGAKTCDVMSNSFKCMSGASKSKAAPVKRARAKKRNVKSRYKVSRRSARKGRSVRRVRSVRRSRRSLRKNRSLRTIGRRLNSKSVRKLTKRSRRSYKKSRKSASKRGWRTRSRGLGYAAAHRGVSTSCFPARLKRLLNKVSAHYGRKLRITSGFRSRRHNRRVGGARRSQHIHCTAADFYIPGVNKMALARYLKRMPGRGGVGTYCGNRTVHLDVGPRRTWHWNCRKSRRRYAKKRSYKRRHKAVRRSARKHSRAKRRVTRFRGTLS